MAAAAEVLSESRTPAYVRRGAHGVRSAVKAGQTDSQNSISNGAGGRFSTGSDLADTPFEMLVLEVLLDATAGLFKAPDTFNTCTTRLTLLSTAECSRVRLRHTESTNRLV
jgi:hypothetical protein